MPVSSLTQQVSLTGVTNWNLNHPINPGMSDGYWYFYSSSAANNTLGTAKIKPYRWGTELTTNEAGNYLTIQGTIQIVSESLNRGRTFHGSGIMRDGPGYQTQLNITNDDAFYFYHVGDLRASDDIGYWDYAYLQNGNSAWTYYPYHQHNPNIYEKTYDLRGITYGNQWLNETDKSFGNLQQVRTKVGSTEYSILLSRIHTPSAGFAHNSHYDVELPSVKSQNYLSSGMLKGSSDRYHAFYISANGSQWDVYARTYVLASQAWTAENNYGTHDLADPTLNVSTTVTASTYNYPFRASVGAMVGIYGHVPVIYNNPTSGFDVKVWQFESANTILRSTITTQSLVTGVSQRPDTHMTVVGTTIYAAVSDITNGGVDLYQHLDGTTSWSFVDSVLTNGTQDIVRIHGFDYNPQDTKFYLLLSGDVTGSGGTYSGSGVYSFDLGLTFAGYSHMSYITGSYGFQLKNALENGYVKYENVDGSLSYKSGSEPSGIAETERILVYDEASPKWYDRTDTKLSGEEYYYGGTILRDGRLVGVGSIENNLGNRGLKDLVMAIYDATSRPEFLGAGGDNDDYFTGIAESVIDRTLWTVGYTKSYLAQKRDIKIHGFGRGFVDGANHLEWRDVKIDSEGNQYFVGNHQENSGSLVGMYDYNFNNKWITLLNSTGHTEAYAVTIDSNKNIYVAGRTNDGGAGGYDGYVAKLNQSGSLQWSKYFGNSGNQYISSIETVTKSSTEYIVSTLVSGSATILNVLNTSGSVVEQKLLTGFTVNRIRKSDSEGNGFFLLAGDDSAAMSSAKFAKGEVLASGNTIKWVNTFFSGSVPAGATYTVTNQGTNNYVFDGGIYTASTDPTLTVTRGATYTFNLNATGHPFWIKTVQTTGTGSTYNDGVVNNGTAVGTITWEVPLNAPSTLYYVCQFHSGMAGQINVVDSNVLPFEAYDIRNTEQSTGNGGLGSLTGPAYHAVGTYGSDGFILKFFVDESAGTYQSTKSWSKNISGSALTTLTNTSYSTTPSSSRYTYVAGYSSVSPEGQGGEEGLIASFDYTGSRVWTTTLGHTNNERILSLENDVTGENLISAGWSESHSTGRRTFNFRSVNTGYGTGNYHEISSPGMEMWYYSSSLSTSTNDGTLSSQTTYSNVTPTVTSTSGSLTESTPPYTEEYYEGGNVFDFFLCKVNLDDFAAYKNTQEYKDSLISCVNTLSYPENLFNFYQIGSAGDGTADDGNFFGYDLLIKSGSNIVYAIGQTSADIAKYNSGGSGVYDYALIEFNPTTETFDIYQNGTSYDEEVYGLTELNDGSGSIAYVGRTTGNISGQMPVGTYDIFLGIYNPITEQFRYYSTGSANIDKAVNLHDTNDKNLWLVIETAGNITTGATNFGGTDIAVMSFNYTANTWSTASYQIGSTQDEVLSQEGKHSTYLPQSNRIAIAGKTLGTFSDNNTSYGNNDMFLALFDINSKTWTKYQIGTQANETGTLCFGIGGDRVVVAGYSDSSFEEPNNGIFATFDAAKGIKGKSSI